MSKSNDLTKAIIAFVQMNGGAARRVNTQGQYDPKLKRWRKSGMRKGFEDIDCTIPVRIGQHQVGLKVAVEVKIGRDKMSGEQERRREELQKARGIYLVAKDIQGFINSYFNIIKQYKK